MGETEKRCRTCGHWEVTITDSGKPFEGVCGAVRGEMRHGNLATVDYGELNTRPNFGCVLWEGRE